MSSAEWSEGQLQAIQDLQNGIRSSREIQSNGVDDVGRPARPINFAHIVSESLCETLRERADAGDSYNSLGREFGLSDSVVRYHCKDECSHVATGVVDQRRCNTIRALAHDGVTYQRIEEALSGVSHSQARYHAVGECAHEDGMEPVAHRHDWGGDE